MTTSIRHIGLAAGVLVCALPGLATAYDAASLDSPAGMQVEARIEGDNQLVIAITPDEGVKLNGFLGVAISAEEPAPWAEPLPLVVTDDGEYFEAPFSQTVSFDPDALDAPTTLSLEYGACQLAMAICVFEQTEIVVHPNDDGTPSVSLTTVLP
jgi:hypothetical protein